MDSVSIFVQLLSYTAEVRSHWRVKTFSYTISLFSITCFLLNFFILFNTSSSFLSSKRSPCKTNLIDQIVIFQLMYRSKSLHYTLVTNLPAVVDGNTCTLYTRLRTLKRSATNPLETSIKTW